MLEPCVALGEVPTEADREQCCSTAHIDPMPTLHSQRFHDKTTFPWHRLPPIYTLAILTQHSSASFYLISIFLIINPAHGWILFVSLGPLGQGQTRVLLCMD